MNIKLKSCIIAGAIGDALGSRYENDPTQDFLSDFEWRISDDTQLTLATCEAIVEVKSDPKIIAENFLFWFNNARLSGLGASTLKALRDLQIGSHWALAGRSGEFAAGNGAAMRIAPIAFKKDISHQLIRDICFITHKNEEAYVGALAIFYAIRAALTGIWKGDSDLINCILENLPDTRVKDRLIELDLQKDKTISETSVLYPPTGYVVDSVPMAIFAAQKINKLSFEEIIIQLIKAGGDTDTNCSMCAQIIGALKGLEAIPNKWMESYYAMNLNDKIDSLATKWRE